MTLGRLDILVNNAGLGADQVTVRRGLSRTAPGPVIDTERRSLLTPGSGSNDAPTRSKVSASSSSAGRSTQASAWRIKASLLSLKQTMKLRLSACPDPPSTSGRTSCWMRIGLTSASGRNPDGNFRQLRTTTGGRAKPFPRPRGDAEEDVLAVVAAYRLDVEYFRGRFINLAEANCADGLGYDRRDARRRCCWGVDCVALPVLLVCQHQSGISLSNERYAKGLARFREVFGRDPVGLSGNILFGGNAVEHLSGEIWMRPHLSSSTSA